MSAAMSAETTREPTLRDSQRWVVKIGSALLLAGDGGGLDRPAIANWAAQLAAACEAGRQVVLVSSGAVAEGMIRLGWNERPRELGRLQAAAAVGQSGLVHCWEEALAACEQRAAQVLLARADLDSRQRYLNARTTLQELLALGVLPVVNENDSVATEEICFGDNDTLSGRIANLVDTDLLIILSDQVGLCEADPRLQPDAALIASGEAGEERLRHAAGSGVGALGRGGMATKVAAAELAARSGAHTVIADGREPDILTRIGAGEALGTLIRSTQEHPLAARKRWLASLVGAGTLELDAGAVRVLREQGRSLLPVGVTAVHGEFSRGDAVSCLDAQGQAVARGLVNYSAAETRELMGHSSAEIAERGQLRQTELIHRSNLTLL